MADKSIGIDEVAALLKSEIRSIASAGKEAGGDFAEEFMEAAVDGVKKHSKELKSEIAKVFDDFNRKTNNFKSRKTISNAEWSSVLALSKELMKSERYVDSIRDKLSDITVTFKGAGKISGIDKILDEFEKGSAIESVLWSEAGKNYKKRTNVRKPKVEVPVVQADPAPVVKAEEKKQNAIKETTKALREQEKAAKQVAAAIELTAEEQKELNDLNKVANNHKAWVDYLDQSLDKSRFGASGKRDAAAKLRSRTAYLISQRRENYKYAAGEYAKEMAEVAWMHAYQEAEKQGVARSVLNRYDTDARYNYESNLKTLQDERAFREQKLADTQKEINLINNKTEAQRELNKEKKSESASGAAQAGDSSAEIQRLITHMDNLGEAFKETQRCKELFNSLTEGIKSGSITAAQAIDKMSSAYEEADQIMTEYSTKAASLLNDESLPSGPRHQIFDEIGKQVYSGAVTLDDALERIRTLMNELRQQSADDITGSLGADSENLEKFVSQLKKLSGTELTRIFDSVDLKAFLEMFNVDKSNFATFRILFEELMQIQKAMDSGVDVGNAFDLKMEEITNTIMKLGGHMSDISDNDYMTQLQQFYKHMSGVKIQYNDTIKGDFTKDQWKSLMSSFKNRLTADSTKGISSDSLYEELASLWPSLFKEDLAEQDRFKLIFKKLEEASVLRANGWKTLIGFAGEDRVGIQDSVNGIYSKMSNALYADESADSIDLEANAFKDVAQSAEKAAKAKERFDTANQKVKKGADASANSLDDEADSMARVVAASPPSSDGWDVVTQYKTGDNDEPSAIRRARTVRMGDSNRQIAETLTLGETGEWEIAGTSQTDNYRIVRQEELNALYKERERCLTSILKCTKEVDNADTEGGRNAAREVLALEQDRLETINASINAYGDLVSQQKLGAQDDKLVANTREYEQKMYVDLTEEAQTEAVNAALQRRQNILNNVIRLEKQLNNASSDDERNTINAILESERERARIVEREIGLYQSAQAAQKVQQQDAKAIEKSRQQQQQQTIADTKRAAEEQERLNKKRAESIEQKYDEYLGAKKSVQKFDLDMSGSDHTDSRANEYKKMVNAQKDLLELGVDVNKIGESDVLTLQQKEKLLKKEAKYYRDIHDLIVSTSDKERDMQKKADNEAIDPYKKSYGKELEALKKIETNVRSFGEDGVSSTLQTQIEGYKKLINELSDLNGQLNKNPSLAKDEKFAKHYDDVALKASKARAEIEGIFKGSQKLQKLGTLVAVGTEDVTKLGNLRVAMMEFANTTWDGEAKIAGFNQNGQEMYVTLDRGAGAVENITVALNKASGHLQAFSTGTSKATNEWNNFKAQAAGGVRRLSTMYLSFYDLVRYGRKGVEAVKEIDLAMTELKKVTDETDASYKEFLNDASGTSAIIGSTISDFTEATATFARLGYSMEESSSMAETAIIYKNVAD